MIHEDFMNKIIICTFILIFFNATCSAKSHEQLITLRKQLTALEKSVAQDYERLTQAISKKLQQIDDLLKQEDEQAHEVAQQIMNNLLADHKKLEQYLRNHAALKSGRIVVVDDNSPSMIHRAKTIATNAMDATKQGITSAASGIKQGTQRAVSWTKSRITK